MQSLNGMPVHQNPLAQELVSGKPYQRKKWMTGRAYYKRQVKKLTKLHGPVVYKPAIFQITDPVTRRPALMVHPNLMPQLRQAMSAA